MDYALILSISIYMASMLFIGYFAHSGQSSYSEAI